MNNQRKPIFPVSFDKIRIAFIREIQKVCLLDNDHVITAEPESQDWIRPSLPYFSMKITNPSAKNGDDSKDSVLDNMGNPTSVVNSGGVRKMTVAFDCYGNSHEEAYDYMSLWQTALDLANIQEDLRRAGVAVWVIGNVADLSQLLNTGYEGRAHLECTFGIAMNLRSDLGEIDTVPIDGSLAIGNDEDTLSFTAP